MNSDFETLLATHPSEPHWDDTGAPGEWTAACAGKEAYIREIAGEYEARVYRHPTGPDGPDPELAHGPQVFANPREALEWCDAQLGAPPESRQTDHP